MQVIEPVVAQKLPAIAQRATIIQPVVRPVIGRHALKRERTPQPVAVCVHGPVATYCSRVGMLRVKGAEQNNQYVRIFPFAECFYCVLVLLRFIWRERQESILGKMDSLGTVPQLAPSVPARPREHCAASSANGPFSIARMSTTATSDPDPVQSHVYPAATCTRTSQAPQPEG